MDTFAEALSRARQLYDAGEIGQAESLCVQILQVDSSHGEALLLLGMVCRRQNRLREALDYFRRALPCQPNDANLVYHLGRTCQDLGVAEEAAAHLQQSLRLRPDFVAAHFALGNIHLQSSRLDDAIAHYRQAIRFKPDLGPAFLNLANALERQGNLRQAADCLLVCLSRQPQYFQCHFNLANLLVAMGRLEEAALHYQEALRLQPNFAEAHNNLGNVLSEQAKVDKAIEHLEEAVRLQPGFARAYVNLGTALRQRPQIDAAVAAYQQALRIQPDDALAHNNLGEAHLELGDAQQAQSYFREALRCDPAYVQPLLHLAANGFYSPAEPGVDDLKARLAEPHLSAESASQLHFILGYLLDRMENTDEAFNHFRRGNALRRSLLQQKGIAFDACVHSQRIDRMIAFFSREFFQQRASFGLDTEVPVFIVGMPRSGSTLVEQILSQHSQVHGAGELKDVWRLVGDLSTKLGADKGFPECLGDLNAAIARELAEAHLRQLTRLGGSATRVIDKMLDNFLYLGLLAVLFPRARVIHCRRDPRDVCLSCFFQYFKGLSFTWDLDDLGRYYRDYERLMAHWRAVLPLSILDVTYEEVVADIEGQSRRLVAFCGLDWEDRCLRFHENPRSVRTLSTVQVRQPLYTTSVARWRRYAAHLRPLVEALGS